jgi:predicted DNA-binding ribbon-helix-helix protein
MRESRGVSLVVKRAVVVRGHKTSVSLEEPFWEGLKSIAAELGMTVTGLVERIDKEREFSNLSSALRQFVLVFYQQRASGS